MIHRRKASQVRLTMPASSTGCITTSGTLATGVPPAVLEKLRAAYRSTIEDPEVASTLRKAGIEEVGAWTPARIGEQMQADLTKWGEVIRKANIRLEG